MRINIMNVRNKAKAMLFGLLLIIVIDSVWCMVLGSFTTNSYVMNLIGNAVLFSFGGMWVGWKIKTPSWGDAIVFGAVCVVMFNLLLILILHRPFTAWAIAVLVSGFSGALAGVLFLGCLAKRFQRC